MSDDGSSEDESNGENSTRQNSRSVENEEQFSQEMEGGREVTDVRDAPEDGYIMAPSRNDHEPTSSDDGDESNSGNSGDSDS